MVENTFGILVCRFRVLLDTMEQKLKIVRDIVLTCVVLHNMLRTHQGGTDRSPTQANGVAALQMNRLSMCQVTATGILRGRPNIRKTY